MASLIKSTLLRSATGETECVIDSGRSRPKPPRARKGGPLSPEDQARLVLDQAREEAESLLAEAQVDAERIRAEAMQSGYQAGLAEMEQERNALADRLSRLESDTQEQIEQHWTELEPELLKLALGISRKIVKRDIDGDSEFVLGTVKDAIRQLRDKQEFKIRVSPADYELIRQRKEDITSACDGIRSVDVVEDRRVGDGGCIIEGRSGTLDARIETQFEEAERIMMEAVVNADNDVSS